MTARLWLLWLISSFLALAALRCPAQLEVQFTNQIATFTNIQGEIFQNASLVRATPEQLIFKTNDVFGTINLTNLDSAVLALLGVPADYPKKAAEARKQKEELAARQRLLYAEDQVRLEDPVNLTPYHVNRLVAREYDPVYGNVWHCQLQAADQPPTNAWVARLPDRVNAYLADIAALEQSVITLSNSIQTETVSLNRAQRRVDDINAANTDALNYANYLNATGAQPGAYATTTPTALTQQQITDARDTLQRHTDQLAGAQDKLATLQKQEPAVMTLNLLPSSFRHNNLPILVSADPAKN